MRPTASNRADRRAAAGALLPTLLLLGAWLAGPGGRPAGAAVPFLHDQSDLDPAAGVDLTATAAANDFALGASTRLDFVAVWLLDDPLSPDDDGQLGAFSGTLGWAILDDDGGQPGAVLYSGADAAPALSDTGLDAGGADLVRVLLGFGEPLTLPAGAYWLALDEGAWGSPGDGSPVRWVAAVAAAGAPAATAAPEVAPGPWSSASVETAFVLYGSPTLWNQSDVRTQSGGWDVSAVLSAVDFVVDAPAALSRFEVWLNDDEAVTQDDGIFQNFDGTLGWAVWTDHDSSPGRVVCSGEDEAPRTFDTGVLAGGVFEIFRVQARITGCPTLSPGRYWLSFREGAWGSPADPTSVFTQRTLSYHHPFTHYSTEVASGGDWQVLTWYDTPLVLLDDLLFASAFEAGVSCAWTVGAVDCP